MVMNEALNIAFSYAKPLYDPEDLNLICNELRALASLDAFDFQSCAGLSYEQAQERLSTLNEKESIRKAKGVYYTPRDVVRFILQSSIKAAFSELDERSISSGDLSAVPCRAFCAEKTVFDPTCGAGEFLLAALNMKFDLLDAGCAPVDRALIHKTAATIRGNDSNMDSTVIAMIRLLLCIVHRYGVCGIPGLASILKDGFHSYDYVANASSQKENYDIIVGNPPYVEDSKSGLTLDEKYGNIYANVLINAAKQLAPGGSIGFVVPLSYISTPRMKKLRNKLLSLVPEQYILSYADRPDCLFDSVHQKLCIVIGRAVPGCSRIFTGNYQYWYKAERADLFARTSVIQNNFVTESFIPKLGTPMDASIYAKVTIGGRIASVYAGSRQGPEAVYLNRRETFWMKAYREARDDPEYKVFHYETAAEADYCYCLIHSSLFWWYWICVSDCWHVSKELNGFKAPANPSGKRASALAGQLRKRLEETKVYVGTAQTEYEYKHRDCIDEIHAIDDYINSLYGLTEEESAYIKGFAFKYRTSGGA